MRVIKAKEKYERLAKVEGDIVLFKHATLHKASELNYGLTTSFDFADVPRETLLRLAGETLLIRWRTAFKGAKVVDDSADNTVVLVTKMLKGKKPKMSRAEKLEQIATKMSSEEKRAMLERLMAELDTPVVDDAGNAEWEAEDSESDEQESDNAT